MHDPNCEIPASYSATRMLFEESSAESFVRVQELRSLSECISSQVLSKMSENQAMCMNTSFTHECSEALVRKSLQDRISEVSSWRTALAELCQRIEVQVDMLGEESRTLRVVVRRLEAEMENHVLNDGRPATYNPGDKDPVEVELDKEMRLLKEQRWKLMNKISEVEKKMEQYESTKRSLERDLLVKGLGMRIDSQLIEFDLDSAPAVTSRGRKKSKCQQGWLKQCRQLQAQGARAVSAAMELREELRGVRVRLSCAVQAQAAAADAALRRRMHYNENQLHELRWQKEEVERDMANLDAEERLTEQTLHAGLARRRLVAARMAGRAGKPAGELCRDEAEVRLSRELARLETTLGDMADNIARIRALRNSLATALVDIECCVQDRQQTLALDERRARRRATPAHAAAACDASVSASGTTLHGEPRPLAAIQECDECEYSA